MSCLARRALSLSKLSSILTSVLFLGITSAYSQAPTATASAPKAAKAKGSSPLSGFGSDNKEPYKIDANRLEVQQKDNKAVYSGDVVVVQGKMTMRCTSLVIFFDQKNPDAKTAPQKAAAPAASAGGPAAGAGGLKRLECYGPVTITQEKQTATSNLMVYESDIVTLTGNVIVSDGDNIQAGEKLVYATKTGIGTMEGNTGGRIRGIFVPGSDGTKDPAKKNADKKAKTG